MPTKPLKGQGGPGRGQGRHKKPEAEKAKRYTFRLYADDYANLRRLVELDYGANMQAAIRRALAEARERVEHLKRTILDTESKMRYKFTVKTPYQGSEVVEIVDIFDYISKDDWKDAKGDPEWQQDLLREAWVEWCGTVIDGGWEKVE